MLGDKETYCYTNFEMGETGMPSERLNRGMSLPCRHTMPLPTPFSLICHPALPSTLQPSKQTSFHFLSLSGTCFPFCLRYFPSLRLPLPSNLSLDWVPYPWGWSL